jgi:hypothetical protein
MENRLGTILFIGIGLGLVLSVPKIRKKLMGGLACAGKGMRDGCLSAFQGSQKGKAVKIRPARKSKIVKKGRKRPIKLRALESKRLKETERLMPKAAPPVGTGVLSASAAPELADDIIRVLKENIQGQSLTNLGAKLGVHFVRLADPIKQLVEQGKVRKEGKLYFAIA